MPDAVVDGRVPGDVDEAFLGTYDLTVVPVAVFASKKKAVVRFTVTYTTTLASGTRPPLNSWLLGHDRIDAQKNEIGQAIGRPETTQVITWTETLDWSKREWTPLLLPTDPSFVPPEDPFLPLETR